MDRRLLRFLPALLLTVAATALATAGPAAARIPIRVGMGDQQVAMFDDPHFQASNFHRVRYFIPYNAVDHPDVLAAARDYVERARRDHISVLLHISTDDLRVKHGHLPSVTEYKRKVGELVRQFRKLGVRDFGTWNEANHASQPTYDDPARAARFFRVMYRLVKDDCRSCGVVALDVLDQRGVERYVQAFFRELSPTYRRRATIVGIHNYGDVNRRRTTYTGSIIRTTHHYNRHTKIWFTETGGIVKFGRSWPCSTTRAAHRLGNVFHLANIYRHSGVQRVYLYNWTGAGCDARFDAGIVTPGGRPRSAYKTLRAKLGGYLR